MNAPLVSVIVATYNRSNILPYAIGSALDQTYNDIEVLVVGDGCTDDSEQVVESLGDPRVRWIGLPDNSGHQSAPNNAGLREARGELVAYLGHDDLWFPHHLQVCVDAIREGCDLAYDLALLVTENEHSTFLSPVARSYRPGRWLPPSSVVHRKAIIDDVGPWKDYRTLSCDPEVDLWDRMQTAGCRFQPLPRLGVVKIPAALRKDVYRKRAEHEQATWLARLRSEPALEAEELVKCYANLRKLDPGLFGTIPYKQVVRFCVGDALFKLKRRMLRFTLQRRKLIDKHKRYKGL